jgi:hypothetical protein
VPLGGTGIRRPLTVGNVQLNPLVWHLIPKFGSRIVRHSNGMVGV